MGSEFCKKLTAEKFCKTAGRSQCPSCQGGASSATALQMAQQTCPTDPMFLDPAVRAQINMGTSKAPTGGTGGVSIQSQTVVDQLVPREDRAAVEAEDLQLNRRVPAELPAAQFLNRRAE